MNNLTEIEKDILSRLQYHIRNKEKTSLSDLAEECHVAKSTVIKVAKKMGYSGFVEMQYQMQKSSGETHVNHLVHELIHGDLTSTIQQFAQKLIECEGKKNLVVSMGYVDILNGYLSKKLAMFDILAPATYEFNMVQNLRKEKGVAIFCDTRGSKAERGKELIRLVKAEKYYIVAFYDQSNKWVKKYADLSIWISSTEYKTADFYSAKILIFFELLLSELAARMYPSDHPSDGRQDLPGPCLNQEEETNLYEADCTHAART